MSEVPYEEVELSELEKKKEKVRVIFANKKKEIPRRVQPGEEETVMEKVVEELKAKEQEAAKKPANPSSVQEKLNTIKDILNEIRPEKMRNISEPYGTITGTELAKAILDNLSYSR